MWVVRLSFKTEYDQNPVIYILGVDGKPHHGVDQVEPATFATQEMTVAAVALWRDKGWTVRAVLVQHFGSVLEVLRELSEQRRSKVKHEQVH